MKNKSGITLIALIITIIVMLILVGVTVTVAINGGLFEKAKEAAKGTTMARVKEQIQIDIIGKQLENNGNISEESLKEILEKYGTLSKEEKITDKTLTTKENYEIKVSDIWNGPQNPTFTTVANAPDIDGFNKSNTYYVSWNLTSSPYQINENTNLNGVAPSNWYDYTEGVNHWANVKTTGGENDCYWVWIPRYAYKVPTRSSTTKTIEIKFLKDDTNIPIGETTEITNTTPKPGEWVVHPAFTNVGNGGFGNLTGIWVAKFEASSNSSTVVENPTAAQLAIDGGSATDTDLKVRVKPNVTSWREITVNNIFTVCRNLTQTGNSLENTSNLNSHMMKNTEWGAVAYLSRSVYGKNGEVWNNPYYNNRTNHSPITGLCGNETNGKDNDTTEMSNTVKYNETGGENASTTGNVYGIYDMAGGAWECVAGYLSEITALTNYTTLASADSKYKDVYAGTSSERNKNYNANTGKYGDAVYETSCSGSGGTGSWDSSNSYFPISSNPVFLRGGHAGSGSGAGVFAFNDSTGWAFTGFSFRPVVLSSQP